MGSPTQEFASKGVAGTALGLLNGGNCGNASTIKKLKAIQI